MSSSFRRLRVIAGVSVARFRRSHKGSLLKFVWLASGDHAKAHCSVHNTFEILHTNFYQYDKIKYVGLKKNDSVQYQCSKIEVKHQLYCGTVLYNYCQVKVCCNCSEVYIFTEILVKYSAVALQ